MQYRDYLIIGSGFGGLGMGIQLLERGDANFEIWEKARDLGGCWRDNTYPGAACDVPSHLYSYSFAPKKDWSHKFAPQAEIHQYMHDCAENFGLNSYIKYEREVAEARFDDNDQAWVIRSSNGDEIKARYLITATGQLNRPAIPNISGNDTFKGATFHSAEWNHDIDLNDKTVAVIGTGASAIQFVPEIAKQAKAVKLFQRSAPYVIPKNDRPYSRLEKWLFKNIPGFYKLSRLKIYATFESRVLGVRILKPALKLYRMYWKWYMQKEIKNPTLRTTLTPDYPMLCKRILLANNYYETLAQEKVEVLNQGIDTITEEGIKDQTGKTHQVDVIIYGTGFKATEFLSPMKIAGRNGLDLNQAWQNGAEAFMGINVHDFPNLFMLYGPNTNLGHSSIIFMLESQINYVLKATAYAQQNAIQSLNIAKSTQQSFNESLQKDVKNTVWNQGCTSWYLTEDGKNTVNWPRATITYRHMTNNFDIQNYVQ